METALIAMATDLNLGLLADLDFGVPDDTTPDDMVVAIRAADDARHRRRASPRSRQPWSARPPAADGMLAPPDPHLLSSAAREGDLNLGLISVPGPHAFVEAADALRAGLHVMIFSDNVSVDHEIALKQHGRRRRICS